MYSPENGLLYEQHAAARLLNLLTDVENVLPLFTQDTVHLGIVGDYHLVFHLRGEGEWRGRERGEGGGEREGGRGRERR